MAAAPSIGRSTAKPLPLAREEGLATHRLYERYSRQIHAFCLHQLGNREEAEDAVQSTFMNAFVGLGRGVVPEFESAWLYTIAKNVCLTRQRMSHRRRLVEAPRDLDAIQDLVPSRRNESDELFGLSDALQGMPEQQRRALLLREWQGLTYKEIAEELELSHAAVEALLFRARRSLAERLTHEESAPELRQAGSDGGAIVTLLKSLLFSGGAKVAATLATVAATSSVAATPTVRHAVTSGIASVAAEVAPAPEERPKPLPVKPKPVIVHHADPVRAASAASVPAVVHVRPAATARRNTTIVHVTPAAAPVQPSAPTPAQAQPETASPVTPPAPRAAAATTAAPASPTPAATPSRAAAAPTTAAPAEAPESPTSPQPTADDSAGNGASSTPTPTPQSSSAATQAAPARATANATPAAPAPTAPATPNGSGFSATPVSSPSAPIESPASKGAAPSSPAPTPTTGQTTTSSPTTTTTPGTSSPTPGATPVATPTPAPSQPTAVSPAPAFSQPAPVGSAKFAAPLD